MPANLLAQDARVGQAAAVLAVLRQEWLAYQIRAVAAVPLVATTQLAEVVVVQVVVVLLFSAIPERQLALLLAQQTQQHKPADLHSILS